MHQAVNSKPKKILFHTGWVGFWIMLFVATHMPVPDNAIPSGGDKIIHFAFYFLLTVVGGLAWHSRHNDHSHVRKSMVIWGLVYIAFGAFDEFTQQFVNRTPDVMDWLFDSLGVITATIFLIVIYSSLYRKKL